MEGGGKGRRGVDGGREAKEGDGREGKGGRGRDGRGRG